MLSDPRAYDGVVVGSRRVRWFDAGWPVPGSRFHHTVGFGPVTIRDHTEVLGDDLPARLELATGKIIWQRDTRKDWRVPTAFFGVGSTPWRFLAAMPSAFSRPAFRCVSALTEVVYMALT